jgi:hypothetical protein
MGIRSDVGVALKKSLFSELGEKHPGVIRWLEGMCDDRDIGEDDGGLLYIFRSIKWYRNDYEDIVSLYSALDDCDPDHSNHKIVEACHDYPNSEEGDSGSWDDNPWNLCRNIEVTLSY